MIKSMTAFGRAVEQADGKDITIEIKSVNSRYFDCSIRISRIYNHLEEKIRSYIQTNGISRGKVDVSVSVNIVECIGNVIVLDTAYAESYIKALQTLRDTFSLHDDISVMRVASNRDIFNVKKPEEDVEKDWLILKPILDEALKNFTEMRSREGNNLYYDLLKKKENLVLLSAKIKDLAEENTIQYRQKLEERLKQTLDNYDIVIDEARILTECAIFADKIAIDEELVRLASHFKAYDEMLESNDPVGRKIDFLLQEINREINTTGSKCNDAKIAHLVVEMKSELEKIREQIQNIE